MKTNRILVLGITSGLIQMFNSLEERQIEPPVFDERDRLFFDQESPHAGERHRWS